MKKTIIAIIITAIVIFLGTNFMLSRDNVEVGEYKTELNSIVYAVIS